MIRLYPLDREAMVQVQQTISQRKKEDELAPVDADPSVIQNTIDPLE